MFWSNGDNQVTDHFSTNLYAKHQCYENAAKNGGFAVMGGVGSNPGYFKRGEITSSFRTYRASAPVTLPFLRGELLLDLMPGLLVDLERGAARQAITSFTHSTRAAPTASFRNQPLLEKFTVQREIMDHRTSNTRPA